MILNNCQNRNTLTKIRLLSHNLALNKTKLNSLQNDLKSSKYFVREKIKNEMYLIFNCGKYVNIRRKIFNYVSQHNNIDFQLLSLSKVL